MNITSILKTLCEASEVSKIKASVGDKVPASVMDALAKNAKQTQRGAFYDNEAMAIIKSISDGNDDPYLLSSPSAVHSILKKLKKGDSSFRTDRVLNGGSGKDYWKSVYQKANEDKPEPTKKEKEYNETGLKTAVVKSVDDKWFAIFPKNFYDAKTEKALKAIDSNKSHEDLRKISAEIAAKDSGKDKGVANTWENHGNRKAEKDPRVNHWCVSASNNNYYNNYTSGHIFKFIIFVKKNPDGSPNWDERYLWYYSPTTGWYSSNMRGEFANKWDEHIEPNKVLSPKAIKLLTSVKKGLSETSKKRKDFEQTIRDAAKQKAKADIESSDKENSYDINVDDELESMLKGAKRKGISNKKEAEIITKSMPWLEEANELKAKDLKGYFLNHATSQIQGQRWFQPLLIYTKDDYKSGVAVKTDNYALSFLVFNGDEPLDRSVLEHYQNDLAGLGEVTNSVVYLNNVSTYKQLLNALRVIVGVGKSKIKLHRASRYTNRPLSTIHVSQYVEPKKTIMLNLSNQAQKIFDSAYREVNPAEEKTEFRGKGSTREKFFYNSKLKTLFRITYDSLYNGYRIYYKEPKEDMWRTITRINSDLSLDEAKKAVKEFQEKKLAEIEREKRLVDSVKAETVGQK